MSNALNVEDLRPGLLQGVQALGLQLSEVQVQRLLQFMELLHKWNKVYNLTALRNPQEMLTHHMLDSLAAVPPLQRHLASLPAGQPLRQLDVGSGGGLPGVVFAICCPQLQIDCVDTVAKKAAFIQQVARRAGARGRVAGDEGQAPAGRDGCAACRCGSVSRGTAYRAWAGCRALPRLDACAGQQVTGIHSAPYQPAFPPLISYQGLQHL